MVDRREAFEAVNAGDADRLRELLEQDPALATARGDDAAAAGDRESVRLVLDAGGDPNARQRGGLTPLHAAASSGDRELADLLLANGADPTTATDDGKLPRDLAAEGGHAELADALASPDGD